MAEVKLFDDNTFFVLYALSKQNKLYIPCLNWLYPHTPLNNILDILYFFRTELHIAMEFKNKALVSTIMRTKIPTCKRRIQATEKK